LLLVVSDPAYGPCNELAPRLQDLYRQMPGLALLMVSRGDPAANRAKRAEYELTFPIVLHRHGEISRRYAMFATPIAYLIAPHCFACTRPGVA
jgi:peroxiredoxin